MKLPRGIRAIDLHGKPACQWILDGKRKTASFDTKGERDKFAASLAGDLKENGIGAFRMNPDEMREWRAVRARIGEDVPLEELLAVWERHGPKKAGMSVSRAVERFLEAKEEEGITRSTLAHYGPIYDRFNAIFGTRSVRTVKRDELADYVADVPGAIASKRHALKRIRALFSWLVNSDVLEKSPCNGLRGPKMITAPVETLSVEDARTLFGYAGSPELMARLALEAFAGLRFGSACNIQREDIDFTAKGISLPAASIKTRRREYIDKLPQNLWAWLERAKDVPWSLTPRQFQEAKSVAFTGPPKVPHPRNCLRHSFATYHVAANRDVSQTAVILCHTNPKMLYAHYRGVATHADGEAYFQILPPKEDLTAITTS
jgi:integrase